jgi:hypothetical protein
LKAWLNLRHAVPERWNAFSRGLERLGYTVVQGVTTRPGERDILCTWNRIREGHTAAQAFESHGRPVLVAENATWGNDFARSRWYTLARSFHNMAGRFPDGGPERWDALGVDLEDYGGHEGGEYVLLPQRGIGPPGVAMPTGWAERVLAELRKGSVPARVRRHPGTGAAVPLEQDLAHAGFVFTWGSGAAIRAAMLGIDVVADMPDWIGQHTRATRLDMLRRLAWAQWRLAEIASGEPFKRLLA